MGHNRITDIYSVEDHVKRIQSAEPLNTSSLPRLPLSRLCYNYIDGLCRNGDRCSFSHALCEIEADSEAQEPPTVSSIPNILSMKPRRSQYEMADFEIDGPGQLSVSPRHDNDFADISHIRILPTMDEVLSSRRPYMPLKDYASHATQGIKRLTDLHFRHLRYDNIESIIDICYHAAQSIVTLGADLETANYDDRMQTPRGNPYSMFRNAGFVETQFHERHSLVFRLSFACPEPLRGNGMRKSSCLQEGMLAALIGFDPVKATVSVTFIEIVRRESTMAMRHRTKTGLQGM